jgi:hypothetical protein
VVNVATIVRDLAERLDPERLAEVAASAPLPWAQRLGHLLDAVGAADRTTPLAQLVEGRARAYVPLFAGGRESRKARDRRWRVWVNDEVSQEA